MLAWWLATFALVHSIGAGHYSMIKNMKPDQAVPATKADRIDAKFDKLIERFDASLNVFQTSLNTFSKALLEIQTFNRQIEARVTKVGQAVR